MDTLLAAMQCRAAFWAISLEICIGRKCYGTVKTSSRYYVLNQSRQLRSCYIERQSRTLLFGTLRAVRTIAAVGVLVSVLPVFAIAVHLVDRLLTRPEEGVAIHMVCIADPPAEQISSYSSRVRRKFLIALETSVEQRVPIVGRKVVADPACT